MVGLGSAKRMLAAPTGGQIVDAAQENRFTVFGVKSHAGRDAFRHVRITKAPGPGALVIRKVAVVLPQKLFDIVDVIFLRFEFVIALVAMRVRGSTAASSSIEERWVNGFGYGHDV